MNESKLGTKNKMDARIIGPKLDHFELVIASHSAIAEYT